MERFPERIACRQYGSGCRLDEKVSGADSRPAHYGLEEVRWVTARGRYRLVILDELNIAVSFGLLTVEDLIDLIEIKPAHVELVFTVLQGVFERETDGARTISPGVSSTVAGK